MADTHQPVLTVEALRVEFPRRGSPPLRAVDGVSFALRSGHALGLVGESGSGKSMIALSLLGLVPSPGRITGGSIRLQEKELVAARESELQRLRGGDIGIVFQDPMTGLNPVRTIGSLLVESLRRHARVEPQDARACALAALRDVGIPSPAERLDAYPHELSGGLRQRAMIALALANRPKVIVADEPTTALDATIQAQVLDLLRKHLAASALLLITHDLAVAGNVCDEIAVIYHGRIVEHGSAREVLGRPRHPYTVGLLNAAPRFERRRARLAPIPGSPPRPDEAIEGCAFAARCARAAAACRDEPALRMHDGRKLACWRPHDGDAAT